MTTLQSPTTRQAQRPTATVPEMLAGARWTALVYALHLTPRESEVFRCILIDERVSAIAQELRLSEATVHTYRERLFRREHSRLRNNARVSGRGACHRTNLRKLGD